MTAINSYSTGTISVANGDTVIIGNSTIWSGVNARPGDRIIVDGLPDLAIKDVIDTNHLSLWAPWTGGDKSGVGYTIIQESSLRFAGSTAMADVSKMVAALNTDGFYVFVAPDLTEPDPSLGEEDQFALQVSTGKLWLKTGGVWVFQGIYKGFKITGPWSGATAYAVGDVVSLAGSSYVALAPSTNQTPPNATYWQVLAAKGDTGSTGPAAWTAPAAWVTGTAYAAGPPASAVVQAGETYVCLVSHTSGTFATDLAAGKWIKVAQKGTGDLLSTNNLSDLVNKDTALGNLRGLSYGVAQSLTPTQQNQLGDNGGLVRAVKVQKFTANGTYTPSAGMLYCIIECWGGGGGGGGVLGQAGVIGSSGGGGAGSKSIKFATAADIGASKAVTIGAGGNGGVNAAVGSPGGDTSLGSLCIGKGGSGGGYISGASSLGLGGAGGVTGTGDITGTGEPGGTGVYLTGTVAYIATGKGGSTEIGGGGLANSATSFAGGGAGTGFGSGGGGGSVVNSGAGVGGGNGAPGFALITEFCSK